MPWVAACRVVPRRAAQWRARRRQQGRGLGSSGGAPARHLEVRGSGEGECVGGGLVGTISPLREHLAIPGDIFDHHDLSRFVIINTYW